MTILTTKRTIIRRGCVSLAAALVAMPIAALAQDNQFAPGWVMDSEISALRFQSVKNVVKEDSSTYKVESSTFAKYIGTIDSTGLANVRILLDSIDTQVDLRNVRMRFLMLETFQFPEAVITMQIDPAIIADLTEVRRKVVMMPYQISLHGVTSDRQAEMAITLLTDDKISVTSATPISLPTADFNLDEGVKKLEEAANVVIIPSATVTFDFTFDRAASPAAFDVAVAEGSEAAGLSVAIEEEGDFSLAACTGRFEIMSRAENIYFETSSADLEDSSAPLLDSLVKIIERCPDLTVQIAGHTDTDGSADWNQTLSEARATSVENYLVEKGIPVESLRSVGFGEEQPAVANDSSENKRRNRRIEFAVVDG